MKLILSLPFFSFTSSSCTLKKHKRLAVITLLQRAVYVSSMCDRLHCMCVGGSLSLIVVVNVRIASFWHTRVFLGATFFSLEAVGKSGLDAALARLAEFLRKDMVDCLYEIMKHCANTWSTVQSCVCALVYRNTGVAVWCLPCSCLPCICSSVLITVDSYFHARLHVPSRILVGRTQLIEKYRNRDSDTDTQSHPFARSFLP
jgi:hypothetical protein